MKILSEFEPKGMIDYVILPWWLLRWFFAWGWTQAWGWWRITRLGHVPGAWMWGRYESPEPIFCPRCLWAGPTRWTVHTYSASWDDDVEPVDECPRCGNEL